MFLRFGAVDYDCEVWVNGQSVGTHRGGYSSFGFDVTEALKPGENTVTVCAEDDTRDPMQPSGKQSGKYESHGCFYTRTTGIWQTVWLEWMNESHFDQVRLTPDAANGEIHIRAKIAGGKGCTMRAATAYKDDYTGTAEVRVNDGWAEATVKLTKIFLWNVGDGKLYDLQLQLMKDGEPVDSLSSYFGLRSVGFDGMKFLVNGKPVFQRLVLDQGFYPDGIYTAPTDADLRRDIELSMAMGFNGARLHEKVFEARYLYWADRLGYLCWGEMANWGLDHSNIAALSAFEREWLEVVARDYSAPSIIGWCPFNETWDVDGRPQNDDVLRMIYRVTKALDGTRPVIDTSGNFHVETDIFDIHDYEQDPAEFARRYGAGTEPIYERFPDRQKRAPGQPVFVSEYGGIRWTDDNSGWGLRRRAQDGAGVHRPLPRPDRDAAQQPRPLRVLLHPADRRRTGAKRPVHLRPQAEVRPRNHPQDQRAARRDRARGRGPVSRPAPPRTENSVRGRFFVRPPRAPSGGNRAHFSRGALVIAAKSWYNGGKCGGRRRAWRWNRLLSNASTTRAGRRGANFCWATRSSCSSRCASAIADRSS